MKYNKKNIIHRAGAAFLSAALAVNLLVPAAVSAADSTADKGSIFTETELKLINGINTDFMLEKVEYVYNNIGARYAGTPADEAAGDYFASIFEELGYEPLSLATSLDGTDDYFEEFTTTNIQSTIGGSITIDGRTYSATAPKWADNSVYKGYNTPELTGETVYFETVEEAVAADASELKGKIVLTNRESTWNARNGTEYADYARELEAKGASAVVFFYSKYTVNANGATSSETQFAAPTSGDDINIPVVLVSYLDGQKIVRSLSHHGEVASTEATVVNRRNTGSSNVIAYKPSATGSDKYVIVGAHRDSVFNGEGVNDNLSGTVNVLAIAKAFQDIPTDYNIVFALWGGEEGGLQGSKAFYNEVIAPDNWGFDNIVAYYNMDMAAPAETRHSVLTVHTAYRDSATRAAQQTTAGDVAEAQAERFWDYSDGSFGKWWTEGPDDVVDLQYYGSCSDHASISGASSGVAFEDAIPSVYIFWGDNLGDGRNDVCEQVYHSVGDTYSWPDYEDQFTVISDDFTFYGNYSVERGQILATVFALSAYNTSTPIQIVEDADEETDTFIQDGASYYGDTAFTISDSYTDSVTVDGKAVEVSKDGTVTIAADNKAHTITLTDRYLGTEFTYTVTVYKTYTISFVADGETVAEKSVGYGKDLTDIPEVPAKTGYVGVWSITDFTNITADQKVEAVYTLSPEVTLIDSETGVIVDAEAGVLPEGVELVVAPNTDETTDTSVGYDITLVDADGNLIQPNGEVTVSLPVPEGWATDSLYVYRVEDDDSLTFIPSTYADGFVTFKTNHFSTYILSTVELVASTETPDSTNDSSSEESSSSNDSNPKTGSSTPWLALVLASGAVLITAAASKKRRSLTK